MIVLAEGLAEFLPMSYLKDVPRDEHGHISISHINLCELFSNLVGAGVHTSDRQEAAGQRAPTRLRSRCARPQAFDVMLGSQLGVGAYRALVEEQRSGVMVSVSGQLDLHYVPFSTLVDPETLVTIVRYVKPDSDFHQLARFLETYVHE